MVIFGRKRQLDQDIGFRVKSGFAGQGSEGGGQPKCEEERHFIASHNEIQFGEDPS
jgi:hypothetical protein